MARVTSLLVVGLLVVGFAEGVGDRVQDGTSMMGESRRGAEVRVRADGPADDNGVVAAGAMPIGGASGNVRINKDVKGAYSDSTPF